MNITFIDTGLIPALTNIPIARHLDDILVTGAREFQRTVSMSMVMTATPDNNKRESKTGASIFQKLYGSGIRSAEKIWITTRQFAPAKPA